MRISLVIMMLVVAVTGNSQNIYNAALKEVSEEQALFKHMLSTYTIDQNISEALQKFIDKDINKIQVNIRKMNGKNDEKAKAIKTIGYFLKDLRLNLVDGKLNLYKIPKLLESFTRLVPLVVENKSIDNQTHLLDWKSTQVLANAFFQYEAGKKLDDLGTYRRMIRTPQHIIGYLERNPNFPLRDSLILFYATHYSDQLIGHLKHNTNGIAEMINKVDDAHIQQVVQFSSNLNATELAPFTEKIASGALTIEQILEKRKSVTGYFQLLVNTAIQNAAERRYSPYSKVLYTQLHEKALDFYAKEINELHDSPDQVRFASVKNLRPEDLYYIIVTTDNELYTSTYLGLYKRLMVNFTKNNADSLFRLVQYDQFRKFLRIAASYNTLDDFLKQMPPVAKQAMLHDFISGMNNNPDDEEAVKDAVDVADALTYFSDDPGIMELVKKELEDNIKDSKTSNSWQAYKLYSILYEVYNGLTADNNEAAICDELAKYEKLPTTTLKNNKNQVVELVLFYGDADGKASFNNFMSMFKNAAEWDVQKNENWVSISSKSGEPLVIYANLPLDNESEKDLRAQEALAEHLKSEGIAPTVLIHRGHSYHLKHTLKYIDSNTKLAILGSCGGYNNVQKIVTGHEDIQLIASKQVGSMAVNDPLLALINQEIRAGNALDWPALWNQLGTKLKNTSTYKVFEEYVPPYKNISLFVIKLFQQNETAVITRPARTRTNP